MYLSNAEGPGYSVDSLVELGMPAPAAVMLRTGQKGYRRAGGVRNQDQAKDFYVHGLGWDLLSDEGYELSGELVCAG